MAVSIEGCSGAPEKLLSMHQLNLSCLPENYKMLYYIYHDVLWPSLPRVALRDDGKLGGYILAKMEEDTTKDPPGGHVTSLAVARNYRKLDIARSLMAASHELMENSMGGHHSALHVRVSNRAASSLYAGLGYYKEKVEVGYYADKEDALNMKKKFKRGLKHQEQQQSSSNKTTQAKFLDRKRTSRK